MDYVTAVDKFISELNTESSETLKAYRSDLKLFGMWLAANNRDFLQVNRKDIAEFIIWLKEEKENAKKKCCGLSASSINRRIACISSFYEYLGDIYEELGVVNPVRKRHYIKLRKRLPLPVGAETVKKLFSGVTNSRDLAIFKWFVSSGLRLSELCKLNDADVNIYSSIYKEKKVLLGEIRVTNGKGGKDRITYVEEDAIRSYFDYLRTRPPSKDNALFITQYLTRITPRCVQERLHHWCEKLNIPKFNIHRLRHEFGTRMIANDMDILSLADLMGHSSVETTRRYVKVSNTKVKESYMAAASKRHAFFIS